jgi:transitional endoplasmic reticulum ATPase
MKIPNAQVKPPLRRGRRGVTQHHQSEYDDVCRQWILKALIELGGHRDAIHSTHCSEVQMFSFAGVEAKFVSGDDYNEATALGALKVQYQRYGKGAPRWPEKSRAMVNARWLQKQISLSDLDIHILLVCVLARTNHALGVALEGLGSLSNLRAYSLLSTMLCVTPQDISSALSPEGLLTRSGLAKLDSGAHFSFIAKIDLLDGISDRLFMGYDDCFNIFQDNFVAAPPPTLRLDQFSHLQPHLGYLVDYLKYCLRTAQVGANVLIYGPPGTGKTELVRALSTAVEASMYEVAVSRGEGHRIGGVQRLSAYALTQRILAERRDSIIFFDEIEDIDEVVSDDDGDPFTPRRGSGRKGWFNKVLESNRVPAIWVSNRIRQIDRAHRRRFDIHLHVDVPPVPVRARILESHARSLGASEKWCERMARIDGIGPALMTRTTRVASAVLQSQPQAKPEAVLEGLFSASLKAMDVQARVSRSEHPTIDYDPSYISTSVNVKALVAGLRNAPCARLCFYGPPGTGKSALAMHIASELGKPAMLKRCSDLLGSFVGESERNVADAFQAARQDGAVLIIDEADSFLGSRERAQQSWEASLVNEFLQQLEAFDDGIVVVTTNLMGRLDEATYRRFDAKVAFDFMGREQVSSLMRRACEALGLMEPGCEELVSGLQNLTPGDFAAVMRQTRFSPARNADDLAKRLKDEVRHKRTVSRPIGFGVAVG